MPHGSRNGDDQITRPMFLIAPGRRLRLFVDPEAIQFRDMEDEETILQDGTVYTTPHITVELDGLSGELEEFVDASRYMMEAVDSLRGGRDLAPSVTEALEKALMAIDAVGVALHEVKLKHQKKLEKL